MGISEKLTSNDLKEILISVKNQEYEDVQVVDIVNKIRSKILKYVQVSEHALGKDNEK